MGEAQVIMSREMREERIRQYKNDSFIKGVGRRMFEINSLAKPRILVDIKNPENSIFEIDPESQKQIDFWKEKLNEYVKTQYSDIILTE